MDVMDAGIVVAVGALVYALGYLHGKRSAERSHEDMANRVVTLAIRDRARADALARRSQ